MNSLAHDADGVGRRMALALLLALGLHAALLLIPGDWRSFRFPTPRRFDVVVLPPTEQPVVPASPAATPEPVASGVGSGASGVAPPPEPTSAPPPPAEPTLVSPSLEPASTASPEPAIETRPAPKTLAPPKPPVVAKLAPAPRNVVRPAAPPKSAKPSEKAMVVPITEPFAKPHAAIPPAPKPAAPAAGPELNPALERPKHPGSGGGSTPVSTTPGRLDSTALLGQVAGIEAETVRKATAGVRSKPVSLADTRSLAGFYAADWARKVTRVGEMNFPDVARRLTLSAGPLLEVVIRADGSLQEVAVKRSSGNAELDRAARRIVELAAPYPAFPLELRQQYDLLRIESPWRFDPGGRIQAR